MSQEQLAVFPKPINHSRSPSIRQQLLERGASNLSTVDLLTIILGGRQGVAQRLWQQLNEFETPLQALRQTTAAELQTISGIGPYKAASLLATVELSKRLCCPDTQKQVVIDDPAIAASYLSAELMWAEVEKFALLLLDVKHRVIGTKIISIGTATETLAHPRDIFRTALKAGATRLVVAHNHPSANVTPSQEDIQLTQQLLDAASVMGIPILDHLILGGGKHYSIRQHEGHLWEKDSTS